MATSSRRFRLTSGSLTLNANVRAGGSFYMVTNVPEILSTLDTRHEETEKQGDHGTEDGPSYYGPRELPVAGEIHAVDSDTRFEMEEDLKEGFALPIDQDVDGDDGYKLILITDQDGTLKQIYAKVLKPPSFTMLSGASERRSTFSFVLYAKDPKLYAQTLQTETGTESFLGTTFKFQDGSLPKFQDGSLPTFQDTLENTIIVTNDGRYGTPPLIIINGPTVSPVVTNETTGKSMTLDGLTLEDGERVEIDVSGNPVTITKIDAEDVETDVSGYLSDDSNWIFLNPGDNVISILDESGDSLEASMEVRWRDSWM